MLKTPRLILNDFAEPSETDIGKLVKQYRKERSMTQQQLAESVGISRSCITKLENKNVCPSFEVMMAIATALCIPPNLIMRSPQVSFEL